MIAIINETREGVPENRLVVVFAVHRRGDEFIRGVLDEDAVRF